MSNCIVILNWASWKWAHFKAAHKNYCGLVWVLVTNTLRHLNTLKPLIFLLSSTLFKRSNLLFTSWRETMRQRRKLTFHATLYFKNKLHCKTVLVTACRKKRRNENTTILSHVQRFPRTKNHGTTLLVLKHSNIRSVEIGVHFLMAFISFMMMNKSILWIGNMR